MKEYNHLELQFIIQEREKWLSNKSGKELIFTELITNKNILKSITDLSI